MLPLRRAARGFLKSTGQDAGVWKKSKARADFVVATAVATNEVHAGNDTANSSPSGGLTVGFEGWSRMYENGQLANALHALELMQRRGSVITQNMLYLMVRKCMKQKDLAVGRLS